MSNYLHFTMAGGTLERHEVTRTQKGFLVDRLLPQNHPRIVVCKKNGSAVAVVPKGPQAVPQWHHPLQHGSGALTVKDPAGLIYLGEDKAAAQNLFATTPENVDGAGLAHLIWAPTKGPIQAALASSDLAALGLALSLVQWHSKNGFCPRCGTPTTTADHGLSRQCPKCRAQHFPQIMPAMLVAVFDGKGNVILSQRRKNSKQMTILSGFMLHGESAEETVHREVEEETGAKVRNLRYVGSQPFPFPYLVMLCYYAVAVPSDAPLVADAQELQKVCWVSKADVRRAMTGHHSDMSIPGPWTAAYQLLKQWVDGAVDDCGAPLCDKSHL